MLFELPLLHVLNQAVILVLVVICITFIRASWHVFDVTAKLFGCFGRIANLANRSLDIVFLFIIPIVIVVLGAAARMRPKLLEISTPQ